MPDRPDFLARLVALRPHLWHLTHEDNLPWIDRTGRLESAAVMTAAGHSLAEPRTAYTPVATAAGEPVVLNDQRPLVPSKIGFEGGWTFADLLADLNGRVFFWLGDAGGPVTAGRRHFAKYRREPCVVLRFAAADILAANPDRVPEFTRCNSGAPRNPKISRRGPDTFFTAEEATCRPGQVQEWTYRDGCVLPEKRVVVSSSEFASDR